MPTIGYCHDCGSWVYVGPDLGCPSGHPAARVNGWYDSETGLAAVPAARPPAPLPEPGAPVDAEIQRVAFLTDLMSTLAQNHAYCAGRGHDTDMIIASNPVDPSWGIGDQKAEYNAALKVSEAERTVYFWELLEQKSDRASFGAFESEIDTTAGAKRSRTKRESAIGPGSAPWEMGYGTLRAVVEEVAARHGFSVRPVLSRQAAAR